MLIKLNNNVKENNRDHFTETLRMFVCVLGSAFCSEDETRLVKNLFTGYNKVVRPVNHFSDAVVVTVGLQLIQLISVVRKTVLSPFECLQPKK